MAKEKARLVAPTTTNSCIMKQHRPNPNQEERGLQSNSRQSLDLAQKRVRIPREGGTGDPMPLRQVDLGLREVLEAKIISHEITQTPHLKTFKEPWSRIRTLWRYHNPLLFQCGTLRALCHNNVIITGKRPTVPRGQSPKTIKISNDNQNSPPIALPPPIP